MKRPFLVVALVTVSVTIFAQWQKVADNIFLPYNNGYKFGGQIVFRDGIVWGGFSSLFKSLDSGRTWTKVVQFSASPSDFITSIDFFDARHGLVTMFNSGVHVTSDGGISWTFIKSSGDCLAGSFGKTKNDLIIVDRESFQGHILISHDFGKTWMLEPVETGGGAYHLFKHTSGKMYVLARNVTPTRSSYIYTSTDNGDTWTKADAKIALDCYSLTVDACDDNIVYVVNEDYNETDNGKSSVYRSIDGANTFQEVLEKPAAELTGFCIASANALYVTRSSGGGTLRSLDNGYSWKEIGGPENFHDTRMFCPIDDNIILAADFEGNLWHTINSGGDMVVADPGSTLTYRFSSPRSVINHLPSADLSVPITVKDAVAGRGFDLIVRFDSVSYVYRGTFASNGDRIDVLSESWPGRALVRFRSSDITTDSGVIGRSVFRVRWNEPFCDVVRFDSMSGAGSLCNGDIKGNMTETIVGNYPGCSLTVTGTGENPEFSIRPNPSNGLFVVSGLEPHSVISLTVLDVLGNVIHEDRGPVSSEQTITINLEKESAGAYYVRINSGTTVETFKIVKY